MCSRCVGIGKKVDASKEMNANGCIPGAQALRDVGPLQGVAKGRTSFTMLVTEKGERTENIMSEAGAMGEEGLAVGATRGARGTCLQDGGEVVAVAAGAEGISTRGIVGLMRVGGRIRSSRSLVRIG